MDPSAIEVAPSQAYEQELERARTDALRNIEQQVSAGRSSQAGENSPVRPEAVDEPAPEIDFERNDMPVVEENLEVQPSPEPEPEPAPAPPKPGGTDVPGSQEKAAGTQVPGAHEMSSDWDLSPNLLEQEGEYEPLIPGQDRDFVYDFPEQRPDAGEIPLRLPDGVTKALALGVMYAESRGDRLSVGPETKFGQAKGLMQLLDSTGEEWFEKAGLPGKYDPFNAEINVRLGIDYLNFLLKRYDGDTRLALSAFNWGMGNVDKAVNNAMRKGRPKTWDAVKYHIPQEARGQVEYYISEVLNSGGAPAVKPNDREKAFAGLGRGRETAEVILSKEGARELTKTSKLNKLSEVDGTITGEFVKQLYEDDEEGEGTETPSRPSAMAKARREVVEAIQAQAIGAARMAMFGWEDEGFAFIRSYVRGESYEEALAAAQRIRQRLMEKYPGFYASGLAAGIFLPGPANLAIRAVGKGARAGAQLAGKAGGKLAEQAAKYSPRIAEQATGLLASTQKVARPSGELFAESAKGAALGGLVSGVAGAGESTPGNRRTAFAQAVPLGVALGGSLGLAGALFARGIDARTFYNTAVKLRAMYQGERVPSFSKAEKLVYEQIKQMGQAKAKQSLGLLESDPDLQLIHIANDTGVAQQVQAMTVTGPTASKIRGAVRRMLYGEEQVDADGWTEYVGGRGGRASEAVIAQGGFAPGAQKTFARSLSARVRKLEEDLKAEVRGEYEKAFAKDLPEVETGYKKFGFGPTRPDKKFVVEDASRAEYGAGGAPRTPEERTAAFKESLKGAKVPTARERNYRGWQSLSRLKKDKDIKRTRVWTAAKRELAENGIHAPTDRQVWEQAEQFARRKARLDVRPGPDYTRTRKVWQRVADKIKKARERERPPSETSIGTATEAIGGRKEPTELMPQKVRVFVSDEIDSLFEDPITRPYIELASTKLGNKGTVPPNEAHLMQTAKQLSYGNDYAYKKFATILHAESPGYAAADAWFRAGKSKIADMTPELLTKLVKQLKGGKEELLRGDVIGDILTRTDTDVVAGMMKVLTPEEANLAREGMLEYLHNQVANLPISLEGGYSEWPKIFRTPKLKDTLLVMFGKKRATELRTWYEKERRFHSSLKPLLAAVSPTFGLQQAQANQLGQVALQAGAAASRWWQFGAKAIPGIFGNVANVQRMRASMDKVSEELIKLVVFDRPGAINFMERAIQQMELEAKVTPEQIDKARQYALWIVGASDYLGTSVAPRYLQIKDPRREGDIDWSRVRTR